MLMRGSRWHLSLVPHFGLALSARPSPVTSLKIYLRLCSNFLRAKRQRIGTAKTRQAIKRVAHTSQLAEEPLNRSLFNSHPKMITTERCRELIKGGHCGSPCGGRWNEVGEKIKSDTALHYKLALLDFFNCSPTLGNPTATLLPVH